MNTCTKLSIKLLLPWDCALHLVYSVFSNVSTDMQLLTKSSVNFAIAVSELTTLYAIIQTKKLMMRNIKSSQKL